MRFKKQVRKEQVYRAAWEGLTDLQINQIRDRIQRLEKWIGYDHADAKLPEAEKPPWQARIERLDRVTGHLHAETREVKAAIEKLEREEDIQALTRDVEALNQRIRDLKAVLAANQACDSTELKHIDEKINKIARNLHDRMELFSGHGDALHLHSQRFFRAEAKIDSLSDLMTDTRTAIGQLQARQREMKAEIEALRGEIHDNLVVPAASPESVTETPAGDAEVALIIAVKQRQGGIYSEDCGDDYLAGIIRAIDSYRFAQPISEEMMNQAILDTDAEMSVYDMIKRTIRRVRLFDMSGGKPKGDSDGDSDGV